MFIAFLVLAAVALIFLFVYNTRNVRSAARNSEKKAEPDKPRRKQAVREQLQETSGLEKEQESPSPVKNTAINVERMKESGEDKAYRDAIRSFAELGKEAGRNVESAQKERRDSDLSYRDALRSMSKSGAEGDDKDK
ncbi:hypothetical protein [Paenibacillus medicaginis]|uniref:Uncharacterized protein n=1 Tax=Paenibacillus medicaginis TaxID=1470560 RepID=A0ABV5C6Q5_9BACL